MSRFLVRAAEPADLEGAVASVCGLFDEDTRRHDPAMNVSWPVHEGAGYVTDLIADPTCLLLLAGASEGDGAGERTVGHLVGKLIEPSSFWVKRIAVLESMWVAPQVRSQGAGGLLVQEFFGWARSRQAELASVTAFAANHGAQRFYARNGFTPQSVTLRTAL